MVFTFQFDGFLSYFICLQNCRVIKRKKNSEKKTREMKMLALICGQLLLYCLSAPFSMALSEKNEVVFGINSTKTETILHTGSFY